MPILDLAKGVVDEGIEVFGDAVGDCRGRGDHGIPGLFGHFLAVALIGHFHMVAVLYDLKHLGSELHLVPERVRDGLRQRRRTAHNVAGETGALVPHQQKVAYAGPGRNFLGIARRTRDGGAEKGVGFFGQRTGELGECLVRHEVIDALLADSVVFAFAGLVDLAVGIDGPHDLDPGFDDFPTRRP